MDERHLVRAGAVAQGRWLTLCRQVFVPGSRPADHPSHGHCIQPVPLGRRVGKVPKLSIYHHIDGEHLDAAMGVLLGQDVQVELYVSKS